MELNVIITVHVPIRVSTTGILGQEFHKSTASMVFLCTHANGSGNTQHKQRKIIKISLINLHFSESGMRETALLSGEVTHTHTNLLSLTHAFTETHTHTDTHVHTTFLLHARKPIPTNTHTYTHTSAN